MSISSVGSSSYDYSAAYQQMEMNSVKQYAQEADRSNQEIEKTNQEVWAEHALGD